MVRAQWDSQLHETKKSRPNILKQVTIQCSIPLAPILDSQRFKADPTHFSKWSSVISKIDGNFKLFETNINYVSIKFVLLQNKIFFQSYCIDKLFCNLRFIRVNHEP